MRWMAIVAATLLVVVGPLAAQSSRLSGTVRGDSGAVFPGVTVTLKGNVLKNALTTTTSQRGTYSFGDLPSDDGYVVTFSLVCFRTETRQNVTISADKEAVMDAVMQYSPNSCD